MDSGLDAAIQLAQLQADGARSIKENAESSRQAVGDVGHRVAKEKDEKARAKIQAKYDLAIAKAEMEYLEKKHKRVELGKNVSFLLAAGSTTLNLSSGLYKAFSDYDKNGARLPSDSIAKWDSIDSFSLKSISKKEDSKDKVIIEGTFIDNEGKKHNVSYHIFKDDNGKITGINVSLNGKPAHPLEGREVKNFRENILPQITDQVDINEVEGFINTKGNVVDYTPPTFENIASDIWEGLKKAGGAIIVDGIGASMGKWEQFVKLDEQERDLRDQLEKARQKVAAAITKLKELEESVGSVGV